jgi:hypothetical protein
MYLHDNKETIIYRLDGSKELIIESTACFTQQQ